MTVHDYWWPTKEKVPALEAALLPRATRALWEEDRRLAEAFAASPVSHATASHGLAYWVFENALVYAIFKDWLRFGDAAQEFPYPRAPSKKDPAKKAPTTWADLVVLDGRKPRLACEAKWWGSEKAKVTNALKADIAKLLLWPAFTRKLLLTFWHSPASDDDKDKKQVEKFATAVTSAVVRPLYLGRFDTDFEPTRGKSVHRFSMAALTVTK